jgi:hypothetical protein
MAKPSFDRDSLWFSKARHLEAGIEVVAYRWSIIGQDWWLSGTASP